MKHEEWQALLEQMAIESYCIDMQEDLQFFSKEQCLSAAMRRRKESDDANLPGGNQTDKSVQEWREIERQMGNALIALRTLGYAVVKK